MKEDERKKREREMCLSSFIRYIPTICRSDQKSESIISGSCLCIYPQINEQRQKRQGQTCFFLSLLDGSNRFF